MDPSGVPLTKALASLLLLCHIISPVECVTHLNISETAGQGTLIINNTGSDNCSMTRVSPRDLFDYFRVNEEQNLVLTKQLDLEVIYQYFVDGSSSVDVTTQCEDGSMVETSIHVIPVNEFKPEFIKKPYDVLVSEDTQPGMPVFCLFCDVKRVTDGDKIQYGNITNFTFIPHEIQGLDGSYKFNIDPLTGNITTNGTFDFESRNKLFYVKVQAQDDGGLKGEASIKIYVTDVDDNPPRFTRAGCDVISCDVLEYHVDIDINMEGQLSHVLPSQIHAKDIDAGVNNNIEYSLTPVEETNLTANVWLNMTSGELHVHEPFHNLTDVTGDVPLTLRFNVIATENSMNAYSTNTSLILAVYRSLTTTTTPSTTSEIPETTEVPAVPVPRQSDNKLTLMLIEIIIPSVVVICLIIILVIVITRRKRRAKERSNYEVKDGVRVHKSVIGDRDMAVEPRSSFVINAYELLNHYDGSHYARFDSMEPKNESTIDDSGQFIRAIQVDTNDNSAELQNGGNYDAVENVDNLYARVDKKKTKANKNKATDLFDPENEGNNVDNPGFTGEESNAVDQDELVGTEEDYLGYKDMKNTEY